MGGVLYTAPVVVELHLGFRLHVHCNLPDAELVIKPTFLELLVIQSTPIIQSQS